MRGTWCVLALALLIPSPGIGQQTYSQTGPEVRQAENADRNLRKAFKTDGYWLIQTLRDSETRIGRAQDATVAEVGPNGEIILRRPGDTAPAPSPGRN
jgi:hypothetical protein